MNIKVLICSFLLASGPLFAESPMVKLSVLDQSGQSISAIKPGALFKVAVNVTTNMRERPDVTVAGLEQFQRLGTSSSSHMMMVNGIMSTERTYEYTARATQPGSFTVGPAHVRLGNDQGESEPVQLLVDANAQAAAQPARATPQRQPRSVRYTNAREEREPSASAFVELIPDKKSAYERQPLDITVKLWLGPGVQCHTLSLPENAADWQVKRVGDLKQYRAMRESQEYLVVEQQLRLIAKSAGTIQFPAVKVPCLVPVHTNRLFDIFGPRLEEQVVSSEPFTLEIKKLPSNPVGANAVGSFDRLSASIDRTQARAGEGLIYKLMLEGQTDGPDASAADAESITAPKLKLPDGMTSYASQQEFKQLSPHSWQKSFEFVVQGTRAGSFTIPPQQFVYFEPHTEQYYTLKSEPITLEIEGLAPNSTHTAKSASSNVSSLNPETDPNPAHTELVEVSERDRDKNNRRLNNVDQTSHGAAKLKYGLFVLIALLLLLLVLVIGRLRSWFSTRSANAPQRQAFARTRKELVRLKAKRDVPGLLSLITQLFAARAHVPTPTVTESWMREYLKRHGMPEREINDWIREVEYLTRFAFYEHGTGDAQIFDRLERWLKELEKWI